MSFEIILDKEELGTSVFMKDLNSGCQVTVLNFGALLTGFAVPVQGEYINVIDGYTDSNDAAEKIEAGFKSARMSPFAGRIKKGHYTFNGLEHKLEKFFLSGNAIHGLMYDHTYEIAETKKSSNKAELHLKGFYPGTDKGYPYKYLSDVVYRLSNGNTLTVETTVQHFNDFVIPYGEGWHPYFSLTGTVDECSLQLNSSTRYKTDKQILANGETITDDRFEKEISLEGISLDDCFALKNKKQPAAVLKDDVLKLSVYANEHYDYVQVYTPEHRNSIAIECLSMVPDAFNHGVGLMLLEPGKKYVFSCTYILETLL